MASRILGDGWAAGTWSRRDVLRRTGLAAAGLAIEGPMRPLWAQALAPPLTNADLPVSATTARLAAYMSQARERALPDDVVERARRHVLDAVAAMVSGSQLLPGQRALQFARAYGGKAVATVVGDTTVCGAIEAALVNGTLAHADETDDTLAPGPWHPGCNVVPAALALAEQFGSSGTHFLRAVALGYDIGTRVLAAIQSGIPGSHKLPYGIGGVFGAAAAGTLLAGFDEQRARWALSYAAQQSSGIESFPRDPDHIEKAFIFGGMPARSGVTAVLLVHNRWTAVHDIMSGPDNFIVANAPAGKPELLVDGLGERYEIMRANIKHWTVGFPIHPPLDAVKALLDAQPIDPSRIRQVTVRYQPGSITDNSGPSDINVQHAVAVMLLDKKLTFRSIHDAARMKDPTVVALRSKIRLDSGGTGAARIPLIQIELADGTRLAQDTVGPVLGTAANPMSREQVAAKARDLMAPVLGARQTERLIDAVLHIDAAPSVRRLRPLLQRTARGGPGALSEYPFVR